MFAALVAMAVVGCSKKDADSADAGGGAAEGAAPPVPASAEVQAVASQVDAAISGKNYDGAVNQLVGAMAQGTATEADRQALYQKIDEASQALSEAAKTDAAAAEAYRNLGRAVNGR